MNHEALKKGLGGVAVAMLLLATVAPVGVLSWGFMEALVMHRETLTFSFNGPLFWQSLGITLVSAILATAGGVLVAVGIWMTRPGAAKKMGLLIFALILLPPFIHVQAWIFFMDRLASGINGVLGTALNFSGYFAVILTQTVAALPLPAGLIVLALAAVPADISMMVKLDQPDVKGFLSIYLPYLAPAISFSTILVFLLNINDYGVASVFGVNSYALDLFAQFSAGNSIFRVFFNGLPLLFISIGALALLGRTILKMDFLLGIRAASNPFSESKGLAAVAVLGLIIGVVYLLVPAYHLLLEAVGSDDGVAVLTAAMPEIGYGLAVSAAAAVVSVIPALSFAVLFYQSFQYLRWWGYGILALAAMPFLIPGPVLGLALIRMWNTGVLGVIYTSPVMPVIGLVAKYAFIEALMLTIALAALDPHYLENMQVHWPGLKPALGCLWHLISRQCAAAMLIVFALSMGEFGVSLLLMPPGYQTLTIKIYNYLHYGASDVVAILCLFMVVLMGLVVTAILGLLGGDNNEQSDY